MRRRDLLALIGTFPVIAAGDVLDIYPAQPVLFIPQFMVDEPVTPVTPVTAGKTIDATWDTYHYDYSDASSLSAMWMRAYSTLSQTDSGIIVSSGGDVWGMVLYASDGSLYFQCGNGDNFGNTVDRGEVSWVISSANPVIEVYADRTKCELYIDGALVDSQTYSAYQVAGDGQGQLGGYLDDVDSSVPYTRLGKSHVEHPYTGSIEKVEFFELVH